MNLFQRIMFIYKHVKCIGLISTVSYLMQRIFRRKLIKVYIKNIKHPIYLRGGSYDTNIFYQIFIEEHLNFYIQKELNTILDLGANIGLSTIYLKNKYPFALVICLEPDPSNFSLLLKNIKKYTSIIALQAGVYSREANLFLLDIGEGEASYQVSLESTDLPIVTTVSCFSLDSIMSNYKLDHIDLVKIDIEGAEEEVLLQNNQWVDNITYMAVEIHESFKPGLYDKIVQKYDSDFIIYPHGEYTIFKKINNSPNI